MVIDFHTHTFPEAIAARAVKKLALVSHNKPYREGTIQALSDSMKKAGIDRSVILPVATKPAQVETINRVAKEINAHTNETGLISFGGIHPDCENYREILKDLKNCGIRGVKIHPVYQNVPFDDIRYLRILECACECELTTVTHAGFDIGYPGCELVTVKHILPVVEHIQPDRLVLAHMGGWECWDDVERELCGAPVYFDTSFSVTPLRTPDFDQQERNFPQERAQMGLEQFTRMIQKHGSNRILFGSDSPWSSQEESLSLLRSCPLLATELCHIEGGNAKKLLDI